MRRASRRVLVVSAVAGVLGVCVLEHDDELNAAGSLGIVPVAREREGVARGVKLHALAFRTVDQTFDLPRGFLEHRRWQRGGAVRFIDGRSRARRGGFSSFRCFRHAPKLAQRRTGLNAQRAPGLIRIKARGPGSA